MSDHGPSLHPRGDAASPVGEVEHANILSKDIGNLFANEDYSDITLVVENRKFCAHRVILASRCQFFRFV